MSEQQYREIVDRLKKAGAGHPPGRVYHAAFGTASDVKVFDVWTSQAAFEKFGQTLMPTMQQLGIEPVQPTMANVVNVIVPPRKAPRAAAKARPSKRAARGKGRRKAGKRR
jgi:hypothetical protein